MFYMLNQNYIHCNVHALTRLLAYMYTHSAKFFFIKKDSFFISSSHTCEDLFLRSAEYSISQGYRINLSGQISRKSYRFYTWKKTNIDRKTENFSCWIICCKIWLLRKYGVRLRNRESVWLTHPSNLTKGKDAYLARGFHFARSRDRIEAREC